jgi:hypothetical protein
VDPYLTQGCEVTPDCDAKIADELEQAQNVFLRRLLGLNPRSTLRVLYSETGNLSIRFRRANLTMRYLEYASMLPEHHLTRSALQDSLDLALHRKPSWVSDILWSGKHLPLPLTATLDDIVFCITYGTVEGMQERLKDTQNAYVRQWIVGSPRLPLLRDRQERDKAGKLRNAAYALRQYLRWVHRPKHRIALTRLMLSDHGLAVERLRRAERGRPPVSRERRVCRLCRDNVEDEIHTMLICDGDEELKRLRDEFIAKTE